MTVAKRGRGGVPKGAMKARKSAAVIILEKDVTHLREDVAWIKRVLYGVAGGVGTLVVTAIAAFINMVVK